MVYNYISSKVVIGTVYEDFNILSNDWENRAPKWILNALGFYNVEYSLENTFEPIKFTNYKFKLPCNTSLLRAIIINSRLLERVSNSSFLISRHQMPDPNVYQINIGNVELGIESGEAIVIYNKPPFEWDDVLNVYFPLIPHTSQVIENLSWYVLMRILARGYVHPVYSLATQNPLVNPDIRWRDTLKSAKNSINRMDATERASLSEILTRFIADPLSLERDLFKHYTVNSANLSTFTYNFGQQLSDQL